MHRIYRILFRKRPGHLPLNRRFCLFQYRIRFGERAANHKRHKGHKRHDLCFLCLLWPFPVTVPLLNFARGSSMSRFLIYMDGPSRWICPVAPPRRTKGSPSVFVPIRVHSWFVFICDWLFLPGMIRTAGRGRNLFETNAVAVDGGRAVLSQWSSFHSIQRSFRLPDPAGRPDLEIAAEGLLEGLPGVVGENVLPGGQQPLDLRVRLGNELDDQ